MQILDLRSKNLITSIIKMNPIEQHAARLQKNVNNTGKNLRNAANAIRNIMTITLRETRGRRTAALNNRDI